MMISDLQNKKVINLLDGKEIGNIIDVCIDNNGMTTGLVVEKHRFIISHFTNSKECVIKWNQIEKIGEDVQLLSLGKSYMEVIFLERMLASLKTFFFFFL